MSFSPGGFFFGHKAINFGTPYYSLTISLNIIVTLFIVYRLRSMAGTVRATMGEEAAKLYTGIAAVLVESAAPYSVMGIILLVPYARDSLISVALGQFGRRSLYVISIRAEALELIHCAPSVSPLN